MLKPVKKKTVVSKKGFGKARPDLNEQEVNEMFARLNAQINN